MNYRSSYVRFNLGSEMTVSSHTQVGIVGAGPAGLLLSHLLALHGIDSIVVENRSRAYCEARQRAGLLEAGTVELVRAVGLGERMDAEGLGHRGRRTRYRSARAPIHRLRRNQARSRLRRHRRL